jgi:uncharacterized protein YbjT (DUF2867 family)
LTNCKFVLNLNIIAEIKAIEKNMIIITTPTGHIGSKVLEALLQTDEKLRVIARDPSKLSAEVKQRVEIIKGSLDDFEIVSTAYQDADELFFVVPPSMRYEDVNEYYLHFAGPTCEAIKKQRVKRVVFVSGTGLGHEKKAGPVAASFLVEEALEATGAATRILHCGTFMENLLHSVRAIESTGQFSTSVSGETKSPWVATKDIAGEAVRLLLDKTWTGKGSVGVLGPEDLSYHEIAKIMSEILGKEIRYQTVSGEELKATTMQYGATEAAAEGLVDIYNSMEKGVFNMLPRTPQTSSPTTFRQWCEEVFKPAVLK